MKVVVDYDLCEANAGAWMLARKSSRWTTNDNLIVKQETFDESSKTKVKKPSKPCPRQAISIVK